MEQHVHYRYRGPALQRLNLYEYGGIINITAKEADENQPGQGAQGANRPKNGRITFADGHPLKDTHIQQIRSKHVCPVLAGGPPPSYPGPSIPGRGAQWRKKADAFARYILTLFKPWSLDSGLAYTLQVNSTDHQDPENSMDNTTPWDAFCESMSSLDPRPDDIDARPPTFVDVCRLGTIWNVSRSLCVNTERRTLLTVFRHRDARRWKSRQSDYACEFESMLHDNTGGYASGGELGSNTNPARDHDDTGGIDLEARTEIDRMVRLFGSQGGVNREEANVFVQSTVAFLDEMFPLDLNRNITTSQTAQDQDQQSQHGHIQAGTVENVDTQGNLRNEDFEDNNGVHHGDISLAEIVRLIEEDGSGNEHHDSGELHHHAHIGHSYMMNSIPANIRSVIETFNLSELNLLIGAIRGIGQSVVADQIMQFPRTVIEYVQSAQSLVPLEQLIQEHIDELLSRPNNEQHSLIDRLLRSVTDAEMRTGSHSHCHHHNVFPNLLVLGGPGVGKTYLVKRLQIELEREHGLKLVSVAYTGVAASNIQGGKTIHSVFHLTHQASEFKSLPP